jgi:hypothetical protein
MLRRVALVRTNVTEEPSASFIIVTWIAELGTTLAVTNNWRTASVVPSSAILVTMMKVALSSYETSVLTIATGRNIPEDTILHSHRRENLKSYITATGRAGSQVPHFVISGSNDGEDVVSLSCVPTPIYPKED